MSTITRWNKTDPSKSDYPKRAYYVTMTDTFFSDSPYSKGKKNKLVIGVHNHKQAKQIERAAEDRDEMKYVSIRSTKPSYDNVKVSYRDWEEMGGSWKQ